MRLERAWRRRLRWYAALSAVAPFALLLAPMLVALGGAGGSLGNIEQLVAGPRTTTVEQEIARRAAARSTTAAAGVVAVRDGASPTGGTTAPSTLPGTEPAPQVRPGRPQRPSGPAPGAPTRPPEGQGTIDELGDTLDETAEPAPDPVGDLVKDVNEQVRELCGASCPQSAAPPLR